eukprot:scaffold12360_cov109-Isochrysis_galbana.AAC.5
MMRSSGGSRSNKSGSRDRGVRDCEAGRGEGGGRREEGLLFVALVEGGEGRWRGGHGGGGSGGGGGAVAYGAGRPARRGSTEGRSACTARVARRGRGGCSAPEKCNGEPCAIWAGLAWIRGTANRKDWPDSSSTASGSEMPFTTNPRLENLSMHVGPWLTSPSTPCAPALCTGRKPALSPSTSWP